MRRKDVKQSDRGAKHDGRVRRRAGLRRDELDPSEHDFDGAATENHAVGTPGGGTAAGGLAGTNVGDGAPDGADLENRMGTGLAENEIPIHDAKIIARR